MRGLGRYYEIDVCLRGEADPQSGYLVNIKDIDHHVRGRVIPRIAAACSDDPTREATGVLAELYGVMHEVYPRELASVTWRLTPYYEIEMATDSTSRILVRQSFDFCAAHRLHVSAMSDAENASMFGRCNNVNSHGHNYRVDTEVGVVADGTARTLGNTEIESIVERVIIEPFDHMNLNLDTREFGDDDGVNPSVEHIARVFYGLLEPEIRGACGAAELVSITVWETDRTSCRYPV